MRRTIFLFGEAEKGAFCTPLVCRSLPQLIDTLGNPPEESQGILYAVQTLLYERELIFFRVAEEGFSTQDYLRGLNLLKQNTSTLDLAAICMPGVGDAELINATSPVCHLYKSFLILNEKDLYDYLMG
ncbi:MAG: hypothetical protein V4494_06225 [Chlamydiota bacterium]